MNNKHIRCLLLAYIMNFLAVTVLFAQTGEQNAGETKTNTSGGYDFYDIKTKQKTGYSKKTREDIFYYDKHGNLIGRVKKDSKNKRVYNYYNADGVKTGILRKKTDGSYSYMDNQSGQIIESRPSTRGGVESLPLQTLQKKQKK